MPQDELSMVATVILDVLTVDAERFDRLAAMVPEFSPYPRAGVDTSANAVEAEVRRLHRAGVIAALGPSGLPPQLPVLPARLASSWFEPTERARELWRTAVAPKPNG